MSLIRFHTPALANWAAVNRFSSLRDELDRLFDFTTPTHQTGAVGAWTPALDIHESKENYVVLVELPGLQKDQIQIALHEGVLSVSGERQPTRELQEGETSRNERSFGKFQRSVTLPVAVNASQVQATYKDGVLSVTLPKAEEAKPKTFPVSLS